MKTVESLESERRQILAQDFRYEPTAAKRAAKRVAFLTQCINYLRTGPTPEQLAKQLADVEYKIKAIEDRLTEYLRGRTGDKFALRDEWYKQNGMAQLKAQRETLKFLTAD
jgi:hypothetical protein